MSSGKPGPTKDDAFMALDEKGMANIRYSQEFEEDNNLFDATKEKTLKIIEHLQAAMIDPYDWGKKTKQQEPNRYEALADSLIALGQRLPVGSSYGGTLMAVNRVLLYSGNQQRRLQRKIQDQVILPLRVWIKDIYQEMSNQRAILNRKRQIVEGATRKAMKKSAGPKERKQLDEATEAYNNQWHVVKKMIDKLPQYHEHHRKCMFTLLQLIKDYLTATLDNIGPSLRVIYKMNSIWSAK